VQRCNQPAIVLAVITLALAGGAAWFGYETGSRALYGGTAAFVIIALLIPQAVKSPTSGNGRSALAHLRWHQGVCVSAASGGSADMVTIRAARCPAIVASREI
jgi:ribosomal protein L30E